jgi:uncharacterized membrane protein YhaH (DUF805 family)
MFKNPFSFEGRIRRLEYGLSYLISLILFFTFGLVSASITDSADTENTWISISLFFMLFPVVWFLIAQGAKRSHDKGDSGWYQLIPFYRMWLVFAAGDEGTNEYGPNPKGLNYDFGVEETDNSTSAPIDDVDEDGILKGRS